MNKNIELKFRYYDEVVKEFVYSCEFLWESSYERLEYFFQKAKIYASGPVQQFTRLKDKNGREIYEGDIILIPEDWKAEIKFINGAFRIPWVEDDGQIYLTPIADCPEMEVIGDIFENPELLK